MSTLRLRSSDKEQETHREHPKTIRLKNQNIPLARMIGPSSSQQAQAQNNDSNENISSPRELEPSTASQTTHDTDIPKDHSWVDPDEPRYCLCNDVSWGTMIACDNDDCEKEWFHLDCVKFEDLPPRKTRWYCPDRREKLKLGVETNGLMGTAVRLSDLRE